MLGLAEPGEEDDNADSPAGFGELEDPFWGPCVRRVLSTLGGDGAAPPPDAPGNLAQWKLEASEMDAARRLIAGERLSKGDRAVLCAASLRIKAEGEASSALEFAASQLPSDLLTEARETLAHALELDRAFAALAGSVRSPDESGEQVRSWTRTRMRLLHATSALWLALDE